MSESAIAPQTLETNLPFQTPDAQEPSWRPFANMSRRAAAFLSGATVASFIAPAAAFADGSNPIGDADPVTQVEQGFGLNNEVVGHIGAVSLSFKAKKKSPTGSASALHTNAEAIKWGKEVAKNCPGEIDDGVDNQAGKLRNGSRTVKMHNGTGTMITAIKNNHNWYTLKAKRTRRVCATEGVTVDRMARFNPMHFIYKTKKFNVYRFVDPMPSDSPQATDTMYVGSTTR